VPAHSPRFRPRETLRSVTSLWWIWTLAVVAIAGLMYLVGVFSRFGSSTAPAEPDAKQPAAPTGLHVRGNQILNEAGEPVRLLGVNRSGSQYACVEGWGIFDGPHDAASVRAMVRWRINTVRIPLNEHCWLGRNGAPAAYSGANYRQAIADYVSLLTQHGLAVILDLHWSAPGTTLAEEQQAMPNRDHSVDFWVSVAQHFKDNSAVLFDIFNEPDPVPDQDTTLAWQCWRDGGRCASVPFMAAGSQDLVDAIRRTGATNIILIAGVEDAGGLTQWLAFKPYDPLNQLAASWHAYDFNTCANVACYDASIAPVAEQVPLVAGEIGESDCGHRFIDALMQWLDARQQSYLAWGWVTADCRSEPSLITNYDGTPTRTFGRGFRDHLAKLGVVSVQPRAPTPTSTPRRRRCRRIQRRHRGDQCWAGLVKDDR
jgi:endoglucanase